MGLREQWEFEYNSGEVALAAKKKMHFHRSRQEYWNREFEAAFLIAKESVKVAETPRVTAMTAYSASITSNKMTDLDISMDPQLRRDMENKRAKLIQHKAVADDFETYFQVLSSQPVSVSLKLDKDDIQYFGLDGWSPEEETAKDN